MTNIIKKGEYQRAREVLNKALGSTSPSNLSELAIINFVLGNLMVVSGRPESAVDYYETSLSADREMGFYKGIADNLAALGSAYLSLEKNEKAVKYFKRGIKVYALMGDKKKVSEVTVHG